MQKEINKIELLLLGFLLLTLFNSCGKSGCMKTTGPVKTNQRELAAFTDIVLYDKIDLVLTQDSMQNVTVESGEYVQGDIETTVINNVLTIRDNNGCKWARDLDEKVTVYISVHNLKNILYHGAGNISSTNILKADEFNIDSPDGMGSVHLKLSSRYAVVFIRNGAADITIEGKSEQTRVYCAVAGTIDLRNFVSGSLNIDQRSVRNAFVNVTDYLDARVLYTGDLYYFGAPSKIDTLYNSSGRLFHLP